MSFTERTLAERIERLTGYQHPRSIISDGSLGYQLEAKTVIEVVMGPDENDGTAPTETIELLTTECEVRFPDPTLTVDGALQFDIEIFRLVSEGRSTVLFGRDVPIRLMVGRGLDSMIRPTFGRLTVPLGTEFGEVPVLSTQLVNLVVDTPMGFMHNREAAVMQARVTHLPPLDESYHQQGNVPLFLEGNEHMPAAHKIKASSTAKAVVDMRALSAVASAADLEVAEAGERR